MSDYYKIRRHSQDVYCFTSGDHVEVTFKAGLANDELASLYVPRLLLKNSGDYIVSQLNKGSRKIELPEAAEWGSIEYQQYFYWLQNGNIHSIFDPGETDDEYNVLISSYEKAVLLKDKEYREAVVDAMCEIFNDSRAANDLVLPIHDIVNSLYDDESGDLRPAFGALEKLFTEMYARSDGELLKSLSNHEDGYHPDFVKGLAFRLFKMRSNPGEADEELKAADYYGLMEEKPQAGEPETKKQRTE